MARFGLTLNTAETTAAVRAGTPGKTTKTTR
jgi:hypothetical protein